MDGGIEEYPSAVVDELLHGLVDIIFYLVGDRFQGDRLLQDLENVEVL